jgi:hypothetical protein
MSLKELDLPNQELRALEGAVADAQAVSLDELAATIRTADQGVAQTATYIKELALAAGDALLKAKEKLEHGKWLPWIKEKCDLSERRAQRYMHLAENRAVLEANPTCVSDLTLAQAERLIKESKRAAPGTPPPRSRSRRTKGKPPKRSLDLLAWREASVAERTPYIDGIGWRDLRAAIPKSWGLQGRLPRDLPPPCNDIGSTGNSERAQAAEIEELRNAKRRLEIDNTVLRSEIRELKARQKAAEFVWSEASAQERTDFLDSIERSEFLAAAPKDWGLEDHMLRAASRKKLLGELERRLPPALWKKHQATIKVIGRALGSVEQHAGPILDLKPTSVTDNSEVVKH